MLANLSKISAEYNVSPDFNTILYKSFASVRKRREALASAYSCWIKGVAMHKLTDIVLGRRGVKLIAVLERS